MKKNRIVHVLGSLNFSGQEIQTVPRVFKKFSKDEFSMYTGLIIAYAFGCGGMFE